MGFGHEVGGGEWDNEVRWGEKGDIRCDGLLSGTLAIVLGIAAGLELLGLRLEAGLDDALGLAFGGRNSGGEEGDGKEELHLFRV